MGASNWTVDIKDFQSLKDVLLNRHSIKILLNLFYKQVLLALLKKLYNK